MRVLFDTYETVEARVVVNVVPLAAHVDSGTLVETGVLRKARGSGKGAGDEGGGDKEGGSKLHDVGVRGERKREMIDVGREERDKRFFT